MSVVAESVTPIQLHRRIDDRTAVVGVIGLGYVGLPLAVCFAERQFRVLGFDVDAAKVDALSRGEMYIKHLDGSRVAAVMGSQLFRAVGNFSRLGEPDVLVICVPTPLTAQREPDMSYVVGTARRIREHLRPGQLVVLESTTYPGTTDELLLSILEESGLKCGSDFYLAFSPEREDPGNSTYTTANIPKIVSGVGEVAAELAEHLYGAIVERTVRLSSCRAAEATKLTENIFRAVNIALVNELKVVYDRMGIDIWEVLDAASTKPFGFMRFNPGPGWGGHCIPLDPFYLSWKAREYGITPRFIELAGEVNHQMPRYVVQKLQAALNERGKTVKASQILILGLAYKKDIDDPRESPAFEIIDELLRLGSRISYHDPHLPRTPKMRTWPDLPELTSRCLTPELLASQDVTVLVTDHSNVDYELVARYSPLVVDTRGVYRGNLPNVVRA